MIKKFLEYIKEDGDGGGSVGGDGGGGVAYANMGTTSGMGAVVPAIPSSQIGCTIGGNNVGDTYGGDGVVGSGDRSSGFKTFNPKSITKKAKNQKKAKRPKRKKIMMYNDYTNYK